MLYNYCRNFGSLLSAFQYSKLDVNRMPSKRSLPQNPSGLHSSPLTSSVMTEIQEAIPTLESSADRLFLALLTSMPLRISELLGLRWEDVDVPNRMLHIHRRISYPMFGCSVISAPKNDASLQLSIPVTALTYLEEKGEGFVFGGKAPMPYAAFRNMWERINQQINLHGATYYTFRHTILLQSYFNRTF